MCQPINEINYEYDCHYSLTTLSKNEAIQYGHYFSLASEEGTIKDLIISSEENVFFNQYVLILGFFPEEPKRISRWYVKQSSSQNTGNVQEPICYGDRVFLYDTDEYKNLWTYPRDITATPSTDSLCEWQFCWNDGKLPPKVSRDNIIISEKSDTVENDTTVTVYKKDIGWMVASSILIVLVIILIIILIVLSYYINKVWKIKLKDFIISV